MYSCDICHNTFVTKNYLNVHMLSAHPTSDESDSTIDTSHKNIDGKIVKNEIYILRNTSDKSDTNPTSDVVQEADPLQCDTSDISDTGRDDIVEQIFVKCEPFP